MHFTNYKLKYNVFSYKISFLRQNDRGEMCDTKRQIKVFAFKRYVCDVCEIENEIGRYIYDATKPWDVHNVSSWRHTGTNKILSEI